MTIRQNLFVLGKRDYIRGKKRPKVDCIFCSIIRNDPGVDNLLIWRDDVFAVSANLYPYNAGHLLLFPLRHIIDFRELSEKENGRLFAVGKQSMNILDDLYEPSGYNLGFNIGEASGASILHLHQHLVPRYPKELGFVDIISGTKIVLEDPKVTVENLRKAFAKQAI